jgi:membrane protein YqaA with SNARE-associated domain
MFSPGGQISLITNYSFWAVAVVIGLESMGLPLPGETTLIVAAIYAGTTHHLNIWVVIASASAGAILGDNLGFWIGREIGFRLLLRYGITVPFGSARSKPQYFAGHGAGVLILLRAQAPGLALGLTLLCPVTRARCWAFTVMHSQDKGTAPAPFRPTCPALFSLRPLQTGKTARPPIEQVG